LTMNCPKYGGKTKYKVEALINWQVMQTIWYGRSVSWVHEDCHQNQDSQYLKYVVVRNVIIQVHLARNRTKYGYNQ
jgi:hypothetical protein